jgi:hypothetical protein
MPIWREFLERILLGESASLENLPRLPIAKRALGRILLGAKKACFYSKIGRTREVWQKAILDFNDISKVSALALKFTPPLFFHTSPTLRGGIF